MPNNSQRADVYTSCALLSAGGVFKVQNFNYTLIECQSIRALETREISVREFARFSTRINDSSVTTPSPRVDCDSRSIENFLKPDACDLFVTQTGRSDHYLFRKLARLVVVRNYRNTCIRGVSNDIDDLKYVSPSISMETRRLPGVSRYEHLSHLPAESERMSNRYRRASRRGKERTGTARRRKRIYGTRVCVTRRRSV